MIKETNNDEDYFIWWSNELIEKGLAKECLFEPNSFMVSDLSFLNMQRFLKKSTQIVTKKLFESLEWTPDFSLIVSRKLEGKLFIIIDKETKDILIPENFDKSLQDIYQQTCLITTTTEIINDDWVKIWFDVKPPSFAAQFNGRLGSSRDFKYLQRMMYERNDIYVNKVVLKYGKETKKTKINTLFSKTFIPKRYFFNDKDGKLRKLKNHEKASLSIDKYLELKEVFKQSNNQQTIF